jgi:hypothetical protein
VVTLQRLARLSPEPCVEGLKQVDYGEEAAQRFFNDAFKKEIPAAVPD